MANGLLAGHPLQLWIQLKAAGFTVLWVGIGTFVILQVLRMVLPRVRRPSKIAWVL